MDTTTCPQCGLDATVAWRAVLESSDGPVEHARLDCQGGHWYVLPVATLASARAGAGGRPATAAGAARE